MNKDEFVNNACKMGYCDKKTAERYAEGKDELTDDDYIEVYRLMQKREVTSSDGFHQYDRNGGKTTKSYRVYNNHKG